MNISRPSLLQLTPTTCLHRAPEGQQNISTGLDLTLASKERKNFETQIKIMYFGPKAQIFWPHKTWIMEDKLFGVINEPVGASLFLWRGRHKAAQANSMYTEDPENVPADMRVS